MIPVIKEDLIDLMKNFILSLSEELFDNFNSYVKERGYSLEELGFLEEENK